MAFRFQKRVTILPGLRLNISKSGFSTSVGPRGASVTFGKRGTYANVGLPGTGMSAREKIGPGRGSSGAATGTPSSAPSAVGMAVTFGGMAAIAAVAGSVQWTFLLTTVGVVFAVAAIRKHRQAEYDQQQDELRRHRAHAAALAAAEAREAALASKYEDTEIVRRILERELWIGETAEQVRESLGEPEGIDQKVLKTKKREIWKYGWRGGKRYRYRLQMDNDVLVGWDEKE